MKVRNGFVSNSSSSSFVMIVEKDAYDNAFKDLSKLEKALAEKLFSETKALGKECMLYENTSNMGGDGTIGYLMEDLNVEELAKLSCPKNIDIDSEEWEEYLENFQDELCEVAFEIEGKITKGLSKDQYFCHSSDI